MSRLILVASHVRDLTHVERTLIKLAALGFSDKEIADKMNLAPRTIKQYIIRMRDRLGGIPRKLLPGIGLLFGLISISDLTGPALVFLQSQIPSNEREGSD